MCSIRTDIYISPDNRKKQSERQDTQSGNFSCRIGSNIKVNKMWLIQVVLLVCISGVRLSFAYGNGAPPVSCDFMTPGHISSGVPVLEQNEASSKYTIKAVWDEKRRYVQLSVTGSTLQGFLIQARETLDGPAVGNFKMLSNEVKYQDCRKSEPKVYMYKFELRNRCYFSISVHFGYVIHSLFNQYHVVTQG